MNNKKFKSSWGYISHVLLDNWCDIESLPSDLVVLEDLLKKMPEHLLFVREMSDKDAATGGEGIARIKMSDIDDLATRLKNKQKSLHLQAINLDQYYPDFQSFKNKVCEFLKKEVPGFSAPTTQCSVGMFLSTPGAVAPFHADIEHNFLIQIKGSKVFHSFSSQHYDMFSSEERENLVVNNIHILENYDEDFEERAIVTDLTAGTVLYHPPLSPHWVSTDDSEYSLSYTISFITTDVDNLMLIHKMNAYLRRLNLSPTQQGKSQLSDSIKVKIGGLLRRFKKIIVS